MNDLRPAAGTLVHASAKLNFGFELIEKRSDGFHEIVTFMVPIDLADDVLFVPSPQPAITCLAHWAPGLVSAGLRSSAELPASEANLATKAVKLLQQRSGTTQGGVIYLRKRTPAAAGLGGGSADAAAALIAANVAWGLGWTTNQLAEIAGQLGSDVPFFLYRRPAVCRGRGERIETISQLPSQYAVVLKPPVGLGTAAVYAGCSAADYRQREVAEQRQLSLIEAWRGGRYRDMRRCMANGLQKAAARLSEWVEIGCNRLAGAGAVAAQLTGSGSCSFGVARSRRHARRMAAWLNAGGQVQAMAVRCGANPKPW